VLYPNDETDAGKELRLIQQYFFCACSIKDIMRRYKRVHGSDFSNFAAQIAIQLNDTHPTVAIPELMRVLVDEEGLDWAAAWEISYQVFSYTNHTLLPEALEKWSVSLFEKVLPRHLEVIYEINARFLSELVEPKWPGNDAIKAKLSIIEEGSVRKVRMGNLCVIGSSKVNGVAEIHSKLVKEDLFPEYAELWPEKMCNVTNGVTPRRWLLACNPELAGLYNEVVGKEWPLQLDKLRGVVKFADDKAFQQQFMTIKRHNKEKLVKVIKAETGIDVSAEAAKDIIYAINKLADRVNNDARIQGKLKVVFMPNYRVSLAEKLIPAADVSEQISTAGYEASGTGNMKMALNGAITIGTLDGANIEIAEEAGAENCAIFGLNVDEVKALKGRGYNPYDFYYANSELKAVLDWFDTDYFTPGRPGELASIKRSLLEGGDPYLTLADFQSYSDAHKLIDTWYRDPALWAKKAIINSATMGKFNSDRSIQDYVERIWNLKRCSVN